MAGQGGGLGQGGGEWGRAAVMGWGRAEVFRFFQDFSGWKTGEKLGAGDDVHLREIL